MRLSRRALLCASALAATPARAHSGRGVFTHGVASGDPLPDAVVLWTRFVGGDGRVQWEVAEDSGFARIAARGEAAASFADDFCIKVDARGLAPGRRYFYRFVSAAGDASPIGETRTAPARGHAPLSVALFSCANLPYGYFHAYGHAAARDDIDLVLHVGDYIYEVPRGRYPSEAEAVPGRVIDPAFEASALGDYYQRYASYHADPDLIELRRRKPIASVWDDHELVNNAWREGARDHNEEYEGRYAERVAAAAKAYFDWMPIRRPDRDELRLWRALDWGELARIVLIDTRLFGRDRQLDYSADLAQRLAQGGEHARRAAAELRSALDDPRRSLLGAAQEAWLATQLAQSKARGQVWQIIAQQVIAGRHAAPAGLTRLLPEGASAGARRWFAIGEQASELALPWNLDSWNGYPAARTRLLQACSAHAANAILLGGDSHNCWLNNLPAPGGDRLAAIEFAGGSVTSPGYERALSNAAPGEREAMMRGANPQLAWCDVTRRGYGVLGFTREGCAAAWVGFDNVRTPAAAAPVITHMEAAASGAGPGAWTI